MPNLLKQGKKAFTVGVTLATIVWSIGIFAMPVAFAATSGDLIKITCTGSNTSVCSAVYYLGANGKRFVFPNEKTYLTWYSDFSGVKSISQTEMESYPIGGNVTYRPGVKMVKIQTDPKVYAVSANGTLRWVSSEAVAMSLYGSTWNKQIDDVQDAFFVNYTIGNDISSASSYDKNAVWSAASNINVDKNIGSSGPSAGSGSTLTAALSPDTPASGLVIGSASRVPFTTVTLTASSDGDIWVDSVTIERDGPSQDGEFSDLDLLDAATGLPLNNNSKSLNASHQAVFGDDFVVKAGTTLKVVIAANMATGALSSYAGEIPVLSLVGVSLKNGATLVGSLPISGNYQNINGTLTVGTATVTVGANNPSATTKEVGVKDYIVSSVKITNNSSATNQDFLFKSITFTQNGSASMTDDVTNFRLVNTNTSQTLGTGVVKGDEVSFTNLNQVIKKGENVNLDLRVDVKGGSARNISLDIDEKSDVVVYDQLRGFNAVPAYTDSSGTTVSTSPYYNAPDTTIGNGKLRIESLAIPENKISDNSKKVKVGRFKFVVEGETVNITRLGLKLTTTSGSTGHATNVQLVEESTGATVAGPQDPVRSGADGQETATTTDTVSIAVGEHVYAVYADLDTNFNTNETVQAGIFPEAITIKGDVSGNNITPTPGGQVQSTIMTVKPAALAVSLDSVPSSQSVVSGTQDLEVGRVVLNGSDSGSDVRVTQVNVVIVDTDAMPNILSGIELWDGASKIPVDSSTQTCSGASCSTINTRATTTLTISAGNLKVSRNTTKILSVRGDVGTATTTGSFKLTLQGANVSAIDADAQTVTPTYTVGNAATFSMSAGGTLQISNASDPKSAQVVAGTTVEVGRFTAKAKNESINMNAFGFEINSPDGGIVGSESEIDTFELWEQGGSASLGEIAVNASRATITPTTALNLALNQEKTYIIKSKNATITTGSPAASGKGYRVKLSYVDAKGTSPGSSSITTTGVSGVACTASGGTCFNTFTVFKSVPTVALMGFSGTSKITGNGAVVDLFKFSVKADSAGPVAIGKFSWGITTTTVSLSATGYYVYESSNSSDTGSILANTGDNIFIGASQPYIIESRFDVNNDDSTARGAADKSEATMVDAGATKYYTFRGTISAGHDGTASNESVSVTLSGDDSFAATSAKSFGAIDGTLDQDDFIWSDLSFDQYSTSTATKTIGWFNGYRVKGLEDTSTTPQVVTD